MTHFSNIVLFITTLFAALMAGLFFTWSNAVTAGLNKLSNENYMAAMQSMNRTILNPLFLLIFMGTVIIFPICTWLEYKQGHNLQFRIVAVAGLVYIIGVFGVTMGGNVPLNNMLDKIQLNAISAEALAAKRAAFEMPWNRLNLIRVWSSLISVALMIWACIGVDGETKSRTISLQHASTSDIVVATAS